MKKEMHFLFAIIFIVLLNNFILAADVAYVLKTASKNNSVILNVFKDLGLNVVLIEDKQIKTTDFSKYAFIFLGDEKLVNIGYLSDKPIIVASRYYSKFFGFLEKGRITKLVSNAKLKIKKNGEIVPVYNKPNYKLGGPGLPYYYLRDKYEDDEIETVGTTFTGKEKELGDVIAYSKDGRKCFFGITKTEYWTKETKDLFKECVEFVRGATPQPACNQNSDCGEDSFTGEKFCNGNVYQNLITWTCENPGTPESHCTNSTNAMLIENCTNSCENGTCVAGEEKIHDVALINFTNAVNGIRLEHENGTDINEDPAKLECNQKYKIWIKVENQGDYIENVTFNGTTDGLLFQHVPRDNLTLGENTLKSKTVNFTLASGFYNMSLEAMIAIDNNPENNFRKRMIEIVC